MTGSDWNDATPREPSPLADQDQPAHPERRQPQPGVSQPGIAAGPQDTVEFSGGGNAAPTAPRRTRMIVAGAAAAVAVVAIAAVAVAATHGSAGPSQPTPAEVLAAAAHKAASVTSLSATFSENIGGAAGGTISGSVQEIRKPLQMAMTITEDFGGQTIPMSAILTSSAMYMKFGSMPGLPKAMLGKWLEIPLGSLGSGSFASLLQSVQNENPASQAQLLLASKYLHADGKQLIDGVETTKYSGAFTPAAAVKVLSPSQRAVLGPAMKRLTGDVSFHVWIAGNGQIRQFVEVETVSAETVVTTFNFQSYNVPVTVTIPSASQVVPFPGTSTSGG